MHRGSRGLEDLTFMTVEHVCGDPDSPGAPLLRPMETGELTSAWVWQRKVFGVG